MAAVGQTVRVIAVGTAIGRVVQGLRAPMVTGHTEMEGQVPVVVVAMRHWLPPVRRGNPWRSPCAVQTSEDSGLLNRPPALRRTEPLPGYPRGVAWTVTAARRWSSLRRPTIQLLDLRTHLALARHLITSPVDDHVSGLRYVSGFVAALGAARGASGRDENGIVVAEGETGHWLGAVAWMVLLDQIGTCFRPTPPAGATPIPPCGRSLLNALHWWYPELPEPEAKALYALRCAFAHDYSLWNKNSDPQLQHCFVVDRDPVRFVRLATDQWKPPSPPTPTNQTSVSLRKLGDVSEEIVSRVRKAAGDDKLDIVLSDGVNELENRYAITFRYKDPA